LNDQPSAPSARDRDPAFPATRWTLVRRIQKGGPEDARRALEEVCQAYWQPVYGFLRRNGHGQHDAEDLTQAFFQRLIEERSLTAADMERGRLRSFLLGVLKRSLADHFERERALRRGGGAKPLSFSEEDAEALYAAELADANSPETSFDRSWALGILRGAEEKLRAECAEAHDLESFEALREFLPLGENATPYRAVAARLKIEEASVRLQVHRMRKRYARHVESIVAGTISDPAELQGELSHLMAALGR
jgi:RNA polymerase sigma-70 factor (ECF subfamily)